MKILFFADLHGDFNTLKNLKKKSNEADVVVCAGDFTSMENRMDEILREMDSFYAPVLLVHGNHEDADGVKEKTNIYKNIHFIHKALHELSDYVFLGYGGDGFSTNDPEFERVAEFFKQNVAGFKRIIFVTHGPPHDTGIDRIYDDPRGNKSYRKFIDEVKPHIAVSGHLHENAGKHNKMGRTLLLNPGKEGMFVNI